VGELEEKLENILGNPQAMAQIMSLAQSLNLGGSGQPPQDPSPAPPAASPGGGGAGLGGLLGALGGLDSGTLSAAAGLIGQFTDSGDDRRTALLAALRPYVREERYAKLDKAIQIAKLSRLIRSGLELFRARKEDGHV